MNQKIKAISIFKDPFELCGPEGLYPVCYVNCNADCGDVAPAQNPIRCQSKKACEEFKANSTREGRSEPVPERPDPEQTTSNPITNRPFTEATTTKSIVFPETSTTPIKRINPEEGMLLESKSRLDSNQKILIFIFILYNLSFAFILIFRGNQGGSTTMPTS